MLTEVSFPFGPAAVQSKENKEAYINYELVGLLAEASYSLTFTS